MTMQFTPSFWDRLVDGGGSKINALVDIGKIKEWVARDVENILNARKVELAEYSIGALARDTVVDYGMQDFAHVTTYATDDLVRVCKSIERAIAAHEHRLKNISVVFRGESVFAGRWGFEVAADLHVAGATELISFQAVMDSSRQNFSVNRSR